MGTIQNHALLVSVLPSETVFADLERVRAFAVKQTEFGTTFASLIVVVPGVINNTHTVIMAPDGSKEYWDTSDRGDVVRAFFTENMSKHGDVIEVSWGEQGTTLNGERVT